MKKFTKIFALVLVVAMILSLAACAKEQKNDLNLLSAGVLSVGLEPTYPPFEEVASDGTPLIGYDVELA